MSKKNKKEKSKDKKPGTDARIGNQFWKARSTHGRKPIFETSEILWAAACEYFEWVDKNPLYAAELVKYQGEATEKEVPKMRAMTILGLCIFLDISHDSWLDYKKRNDFIGVTTQIDSIIKTQKFEGASAELLNPNIIARDLGMADKIDKTVKHAHLHMLTLDPEILEALSDRDLDNLIKIGQKLIPFFPDPENDEDQCQQH